MSARHGLKLIVLCATLAACSSNSTDPAGQTVTSPTTTSPSAVADVRGIETDLEGQIDHKLMVVGTQVECPASVSWQVGDSFRCDVATPGFPPGFSEVTLEGEDGKYSWYISNTCPDDRAKASTPHPGCVTPSPGYSELPQRQ